MEKKSKKKKINFNDLLSENRSMIYSIVNDVLSKSYVADYQVCEEDLFQEGCIALYNAYNTYIENPKAKFTTYAYLLIKRRILHKFHEFSRPLIHEKYSYDSVRQPDYYSYYCTKNMHDSDLDKEDIRIFLATQNSIDIMIIKLRHDNHSYKSISEKTHLSEKQIHYRLQKVRANYRAYQKENENQDKKRKYS